VHLQAKVTVLLLGLGTMSIAVSQTELAIAVSHSRHVRYHRHSRQEEYLGEVDSSRVAHSVRLLVLLLHLLNLVWLCDVLPQSQESAKDLQGNLRAAR